MTRRPSSGDNVVPFAEPLGAALDAPVEAPAIARTGDQGPSGGRDDDDSLDKAQLPRDCPVRPLGMNGQTCWYFDVLGQLIGLAPRDHGKNNIQALFSPKTHLPMKYWPKWSAPTKTRPSQIVGFDQSDAAEALISAAGKAGIFDAHNRVRGRGAHLGKGGALVLHCGDMIMVTAPRITGGGMRKPVWHQPGVIDNMVYPAAAPTPRPHSEVAGVGAGEALLTLLSTWTWSRPLLDPMLALGFIGQGFIGGAPEWRSHLFVTGGRGTGKSTFNGKNGLLDQIFGGASLRTGDASEAAVRQMLQSQTIPVIFDEFEPSEFNAGKLAAVINLARVSSSGADMHRGSSDHKAQQFTLRSPFQFSAILVPHLEPQDRSRFAILELQPFPAGTPPLELHKHKLPQLGQMLASRMVAGWPRFAATLALYRKALASVGNDDRACDQFGTLLTCADLLLYDELPSVEVLDEWAQACAPAQLTEIAQADAEHDLCLTRLASTPVQARGGDERQSVAAWIAEAVADPLSLARKRLQLHGLKIGDVIEKSGGEGFGFATRRGGMSIGAPKYLAIANNHIGLDAIFSGSKWQRGAWSQAVGRTPGAIKGVKVKFDKLSLWSVCVPIDRVLDLSGTAVDDE